MPTYFEQVTFRVTSSRVEPVRVSARSRRDAHCTFAFSQCQPPVSTLIAQNDRTAGGVCEALVALWMLCHAGLFQPALSKGSLFNWLYDDQGTLQAGRISQWVMMLQMSLDAGRDQDEATEDFLRNNAMLRRGAFADHTRLRSTAGATGIFSAAMLARAIAADDTRSQGPDRVRGGSYKKIGLAGWGGAHAVVAWVGDDVAFFDPNFGEFWFESRDAFVDWFTTAFWSTSLYCAGLSGSFTVAPYARKV